MVFIVYGWLSTLIQRIAVAGYLGPYPTASASSLNSIMHKIDELIACCSRMKKLCDTQIPLSLRCTVAILIIMLLVQTLMFSAAILVEAYGKQEYFLSFCGFTGSC